MPAVPAAAQPRAEASAELPPPPLAPPGPSLAGRGRLPLRLADLDIPSAEDEPGVVPPAEAAPLDSAAVAAAPEQLIPWVDRNYPSLLPIFGRREWRISAARLELAVGSELEADLVAANREPVQQQLAALLGLPGVALYTYLDALLAGPAPERPLSLDERRRRLEAEVPDFVRFEQTFQTFLDV